MKNELCICCENKDKNSFELFEYSKICTMNYPKEFDDSKILFCKECNFSFCEDHIDNNRLNLYYTKYYNGKSLKSNNSDKDFFVRNLFYDPRSMSQIILIKQFFNFKNKKILDIGSGSSIFYLQLNRTEDKNIEKYIIEPQIINKDWYDYNNIKTLNANILEKMPIDLHNKFDLITMSHSLEHFNSSDIPKIINNIMLMLKKGGLFFVEVPNANLKKYQFSNENMQPHLSFFTTDSIKQLLERNFFNILYLKTFGENQFMSRAYKKITSKKSNPNQMFYLNKDQIKIHTASETYFNKFNNKRKYFNFLKKIISLFISKKVLINIFDYYFIFIKKYNFMLTRPEYNYDDEDNGEFIRILVKK